MAAKRARFALDSAVGGCARRFIPRKTGHSVMALPDGAERIRARAVPGNQWIAIAIQRALALQPDLTTVSVGLGRSLTEEEFGYVDTLLIPFHWRAVPASWNYYARPGVCYQTHGIMLYAVGGEGK